MLYGEATQLVLFRSSIYHAFGSALISLLPFPFVLTDYITPKLNPQSQLVFQYRYNSPYGFTPVIGFGWRLDSQPLEVLIDTVSNRVKLWSNDEGIVVFREM